MARLNTEILDFCFHDDHYIVEDAVKGDELYRIDLVRGMFEVTDLKMREMLCRVKKINAAKFFCLYHFINNQTE